MLPRHTEQAVVERPLAIALGQVVIDIRLEQARYLGELLAYLDSQATITFEGRRAVAASTKYKQAEHKQATASVEGKRASAEVRVTQ